MSDTPQGRVAVALAHLARAGLVPVEYTVEIVAPEDYREAMASIGRDPGDPIVKRCAGIVDYGLRAGTFECEGDETAYRAEGCRSEGYRTWMLEDDRAAWTLPSGNLAWFPNVIWILDLLSDPVEVTSDGDRLRLSISERRMRRRPGATRLGRLLRPPAMSLTCALDGSGRIASVAGAYQVVRFELTFDYDKPDSR